MATNLEPPVQARQVRRDLLVVLALGALVLLILAGWPRITFRGAASWPKATAYVSRLERIERLEPRHSKNNPGVSRRLKLVFEYSYTINGRSYTSTRYSAFGDRPSDLDLLDTFELGQALEVRYRPDRPEIAFIELGEPGVNLSLLGIGLPVLAAALVLTYVWHLREPGRWPRRRRVAVERP